MFIVIIVVIITVNFPGFCYKKQTGAEVLWEYFLKINMDWSEMLYIDIFIIYERNHSQSSLRLSLRWTFLITWRINFSQLSYEDFSTHFTWMILKHVKSSLSVSDSHLSPVLAQSRCMYTFLHSKNLDVIIIMKLKKIHELFIKQLFHHGLNVLCPKMWGPKVK